MNKLIQLITEINRSWLIASIVAIGIVSYLATADVTDIEDAHKQKAVDTTMQAEAGIASVTASQIHPKLVSRTLTLYGRTTTDKTVTVSSELAARVTGISAKRGALLSVGDEIVRLFEGSLEAELISANAQVQKAQEDYDSAKSLNSKNHLAETELSLREVTLRKAQSQLEQLRVRFANTRITAPVSGILNIRHAELGDFIDKGKPVAEILDLDPLIISIDVPQLNISEFSEGDRATVRFINGQQAEAVIRYIARQAEDTTRTFSVELAMSNPGMKLPAGLSVEATLMMDQIPAIEISSAFLALNNEGMPGIKWVDPTSHVQFTPVDIVKTESNKIWVSGIPEDARVITRGQGFVNVGDSVQVNQSESSLLAGE